MKTIFQTRSNFWNKSVVYILNGMSILFILFLNIANASEPKPWQMDLQEPAGIIATKATDLHNFLLIVITLISVFVLGLLVYVCIKFREKPNVKPSKTSHHTLIEIIWTVVPVLILVVIADNELTFAIVGPASGTPVVALNPNTVPFLVATNGNSIDTSVSGS